MAYVKLDTKILDSTLWVDRVAREVFVTGLLMAEPREFHAPVPQIAVRSLDATGWCAPPGWYGFVPAAGIGIVNRARIDPVEAGLDALDRLGSPEPDSRSPDFDGRRMIRVDGGYLILNYMRYRDYDHSAVERQRRLRARRKAEREATAQEHTETHSHATSRTVTSRNAVTSRIADADADADAEKKPVETISQAPKSVGDSRARRRCPANFLVTGDLQKWARAEVPDVDIRAETAAFRDHEFGVAHKDWKATWRNWMRKAQKQAAKSAGKGAKPRINQVLGDDPWGEHEQA